MRGNGLQDLVGRRDGDASVVRLNRHFDDLSIFCENGVTLASVVAQDLCSIELDIPGSGEFASGVSDESDATALGLVQVLSPCLHDESIVDRDDKNLSSTLEFVTGNVAWNMGIGA